MTTTFQLIWYKFDLVSGDIFKKKFNFGYNTKFQNIMEIFEKMYVFQIE